jgi:hypothetical protein
MLDIFALPSASYAACFEAAWHDFHEVFIVLGIPWILGWWLDLPARKQSTARETAARYIKRKLMTRHGVNRFLIVLKHWFTQRLDWSERYAGAACDVIGLVLHVFALWAPAMRIAPLVAGDFGLAPHAGAVAAAGAVGFLALSYVLNAAARFRPAG